MKEEDNIKQEKLKKFMNRLENGKIQTVLDVSDNDFQKKIIEKSETIPVVVDFWSQQCPPCLMLGPVLEKLANEYNGRFILAKANVDVARLTAISYGVMSIPSVKLFKSGKIVDEFVGALPEKTVKQWLDNNL